LSQLGFPVVCVESRQAYQALKSLATHKTDRNDARGLAHLARTGFFKPAQERAVVGDTPNLAARLLGLAEPGSIVIAESTRRLLGATFELAELGPQLLKGFDAPVSAWSVLREAENVSRFEASRSQGMTPFVGREHEVALLLDRWRDATEGEGQVVLLVKRALASHAF
jgi:hypothetical protein